MSAQTFVVHGSQTARTGANTTSGAGTTTITLDPFDDFHPGERVQATVTDGITTGLGAVTPYVWQFRTEVPGGSGLFFGVAPFLGNAASRSAGLGDLDGDGDLDAFVANDSYQANRVWINDGLGSFGLSGNNLGSTTSFDVGLGDMDGDGDLDAVVADYNAPTRVWLNDGSGNFSEGAGLGGSHRSFDVSLGDVDGDGDLDVFEANRDQANRVWLNDGSGRFTDGGHDALATSTSLGLSALGDLDGDGDLDAFVVNYGRNEPGVVERRQRDSSRLSDQTLWQLGSAYSVCRLATWTGTATWMRSWSTPL